MMSPKWRVFFRHTIIALVVQIAVALIVSGSAFISIALSAAIPAIEKFGSLVMMGFTLLYLPAMATLAWLHFPSGDGLLIYVAGWMLGTTVYSVLWGAIKALLFGKKFNSSRVRTNLIA